MNFQVSRQITASHGPQPSHRVFAALLFTVGVALLAGSALAANLVANGSFETDSNGDGVPNNWVVLNLTPADKRVCNQSYAGSCSFKMVGTGSALDKWIWQEPLLSGGADEHYTLTLWVKSKDIVWGPGNATIYLRIFKTGGGEDYDAQDIPQGTSAGWVKYTLEVTTTAPYDHAEILIDFEPDSGKAWFDKVKLTSP